MENKIKPYISQVDHSYGSGEYFSDPRRGAADAEWKSRQVMRFLEKVNAREKIEIRTYADVGCGAGQNARLISAAIRKNNPLDRAVGYDVSPHVKHIQAEGVEFIQQDFCQSQERFDLVTLLDVFEHVPDPLGFISAVSRRGNMLIFHIPLDDCLSNRLRSEFRKKIRNPGHLIFLNLTSAINLMALSGLRVLDYDYTFAFQAPSGRATWKQKIAYPLRFLMASINPYLVASTIGGACLLVAARRIDAIP